MSRKSVNIRPPITGTELRERRRRAGLSQVALAEKAGVSRDTVQYWEQKASVDVRGWGPNRIFEALNLRVFQNPNARARSRGFRDRQRDALDQEVERILLATKARERERISRQRVICGAKTRKGTPCKRKSEAGRRRCALHGGKSTGPRTPEGRARIADAQRRRWAASK